MTAEHEWTALSPMWQAAFEQAWLSFRSGNYGIGAVLVDPTSDNVVVSAGRNLVVGPLTDDQRIAGNFMAHAEMNAFATMPTYNARGLHLYSTLEPCLMCAATALFLNVGHVYFAATDEYFEPPMDEVLWPSHPYTRERMPASALVDHGRLSAFARLLPLSHTMRTLPTSRMAESARSRRPELSALADDRQVVTELRSIASTGSVEDGLAFMWWRLPER